MSNATTGAYYFKRLSLHETLSRILVVYCKGFGTFTQIAAAPVLTSNLIWSLLLIVWLPLFDYDPSSQKADDVVYLQVTPPGSFYALLGVKMLMDGLVNALAMGAMIHVVADIYLQRAPSLKDCATVSIRRVCPILLPGLGMGFSMVVGYMLFIVAGLHQPAIVIEGKSGVGSLKRSYELVSNSWRYVFCTFSIIVLVVVGLQLVWQFVLGKFMERTAPNLCYGCCTGAFILSLSNIIVIPIASIVVTVMYINLRIEKESMNADSLAKDLGESSGDAAYYAPLLDLDDLDEASREEGNVEQYI